MSVSQCVLLLFILTALKVYLALLRSVAAGLHERIYFAAFGLPLQFTDFIGETKPEIKIKII